MSIVPDTLGAFAIERVVGEGGSSTVYAARRAGETIALKVLRADIELTDGERRRFVAEAERLARVSHPNVIRVLEAGELPDGRPYLALPLLDGETLAARVARAPLSRDAALAYVRSTADALAALHAAGLLHRDVKPENLFVTRADDRLVLLDFGIARDPDAEPSTTTRQGHIRGTPMYMAPERFFGAPATVASEVYELAATLHVLLAGTLPWPTSADLDARLDPIMAPAIPSELRPVIRGALATRVEARPASIAAFVAALRACEHSGVLGTAATAELPIAAAAQRAKATTTERDAARSSATAIATTALRDRRPRRRWLAALAITAAIGLAVGGVSLAIHRGDDRAGDAAPRRVVLVLAPRNLSGAPDAGWIATAIAERARVVLALGGDLATPDAAAQRLMALDMPSPEGAADAELLRTIRARAPAAAVVITSSYLDDTDHVLHLTFLAQDTATGAVLGSASATGPTGQLGALVWRAAGELRTTLAPEVGTDDASAARSSRLAGELAPAGDTTTELTGEAARAYDDGIACLRQDSVCARAHLDRAAALAPDNALVHDALAQALHAAGDDAHARAENAKAIELGRGLSETRRLGIEAHSDMYAAAWPQAIAVYQALVQREPDELSHALGLAEAQASAGAPADAFATLAHARERWNDPRLDLVEATVADRANDFSREAAAADRAIAAADGLGRRGLAASARLRAGWARVALGKLDEARPLLDDALRLYGLEGDRAGTAHAIIDLGTLLESKADFAGARKMYEDALALSRELGNQPAIATALLDLGQVLAESGDPAGAEARYEEALAIARQLADVNLVEELLVNLGSVESKSANLARARAYYAEAMAIAREHDHHRVLAAVLVNTSNLDEHAGDTTAAIAAAEQGVAEARKTDEPGLLTTALTALAGHQATAAHYDDALAAFTAAEAVQAKANDKAGLISTRTTHVGVLADADRVADADALATATLADVDPKTDPSDYGWLHLHLGRIALDRNQLDRAESNRRAAAAVVETAGDAELTAETQLLDAGILAAHGRLADAEAELAKVRAFAAANGEDTMKREVDVISAQFALHYRHDASARPALEALAKDARAHGAIAVARRAEETLAAR